MENLEERITLVTNAVSDKRHEIKALAQNAINVGGQSLYPAHNQSFTKAQMSTNK
jgi:hypothetical protein